MAMQQYIVSIFIILGSAAVAFIIQKFLFPKLQNWTTETKWDGDDILVRVLSKSFFLWMVLGGAYVSFLYAPFSQHEKDIFEKIILVIFILSLAVSFSTMVVSFFQIHSSKKNQNLPTTSIFINLVRILTFVLATLVILESFGISIIPFLTALGIGGLAVALALQDTLSNFFSGFYMLVSHNFKPHDFVELECKEKGYIQDISWRNTTILTLDNNMVIIPNAKMASSIIKNYSKPDEELTILIDVKVSYKSDLEKVERMVEEVGTEIMKKIPGAVENFIPFIRYNTFADSGINFTVILVAQKFVDQYLIKHEFIKALHLRFRKEKVEIPFPQMEVHVDSSGKKLGAK
jgi:small-conductance mechanosensitive channel